MRALLIVLLLAAGGTAEAAPREFGAEAKAFYRIVACGGSAAVDAKLEKIVAAHCKAVAKQVAVFWKRYGRPASAFFAEHRPGGLPSTVVYPFGGGDLVSALHSESVKLQQMERGPLPGQLSFHIMGAAVMGYEPVGLRFFRLEADGTITYYTDAEIAELEGTRAKRKKGTWTDTDWSVAYTNMELQLRKAGDASSPVITHRHFAANLENSGFDGSPLEKHLEAKGKISAMTKAASYLMWMNKFSAIRDYLASHLAWMASDTTGIPPRHAKAAGLEQETFGRFGGTMMPTNKTDQGAFVRLFKKQGFRKLKFRYGYRDHEDRPHLVITRPVP
jgi:hypothetical protein